MRALTIPTIAVVIAGILLSGCAIVWGKAWHVEYENADVVKIRYDAGLMDAWRVQSHADDICSKYGKMAVAKSQQAGVIIKGGSVAEVVFSCDTEEEARDDQPVFLGNFDNGKVLGALGAIAGGAASSAANARSGSSYVPPSPASAYAQPMGAAPVYVPAPVINNTASSYMPPPPRSTGCIGAIRVPGAVGVPCP